MRGSFKTRPDLFMPSKATTLDATRHTLEDLLLVRGTDAIPITNGGIGQNMQAGSRTGNTDADGAGVCKSDFFTIAWAKDNMSIINMILSIYDINVARTWII